MRERILETATSLFVERGYDGVAMREISDACGITKAALYYHFTGKAELLSEIFTAYLDEIAVVISAGVEGGGSAEAQLRRVVRGMFDVPVERRAILRLAMHDVGSLEAEHRAAFGQAYRQRFIGPCSRSSPTEWPRASSYPKIPSSSSGCCSAWSTRSSRRPGVATSHIATADADTVDDLLDIFCHGLARTD